MTSLCIQLQISLLIVVGLSHNLVRVVWVVHDTLWSYKILCDIIGHVDLLGRLHGKWLFSLLFDLSIHNSSILDRITSNVQLWSLLEELPVANMIHHQFFLNWDISVKGSKLTFLATCKLLRVALIWTRKLLCLTRN